MLKKRFWVVPLAALIIVSLLIILGGFAIQRISWSQGYRMGQLAAGGEGVAVVPHAPYGFGHPGLFITIGLLFLLLIVVGKFFRFWAWRMAGGPWMMAGGPRGEYWPRHWHRPRGPMPPWCWGWEKPSEEKAEQAGPGAGSDAVET
jgi:hypothetical protein